ncbi:MAG TPA: hypothetical protein VF244_03260, partial [Acidimicrobiales bacterium]
MVAAGCLVLSLLVGVPPAQAAPLVENFDGVVAPALPAGWTTSVTSPIPGKPHPPWVTTASAPVDTAPNVAFAPNPDHITDNVLVSPVVAISPLGPQLSFRHRVDLEDRFDGGVLEIKIGGGPFTDILAAGGSFLAGGYNGVIEIDHFNPIEGRPAWTGNFGAFITTTVSLPAAASAQNVQFRWRLATDDSVGRTGWRLDTISTSESCTQTTPPTGALVGTADADDLAGTPGPDRIYGLGG